MSPIVSGDRRTYGLPLCKRAIGYAVEDSCHGCAVDHAKRKYYRPGQLDVGILSGQRDDGNQIEQYLCCKCDLKKCTVEQPEICQEQTAKKIRDQPTEQLVRPQAKGYCSCAKWVENGLVSQQATKIFADDAFLYFEHRAGLDRQICPSHHIRGQHVTLSVQSDLQGQDKIVTDVRFQRLPKLAADGKERAGSRG